MLLLPSCTIGSGGLLPSVDEHGVLRGFHRFGGGEWGCPAPLTHQKRPPPAPPHPGEPRLDSPPGTVASPGD